MENLLFQLGLAIGLMAIAALVAGHLKLSVVPLLILAGFAVGPHAPSFGIFDLRFIQSKPLIDFMGRLGILFLLFYLGLEFSVGRLLRAGRSIMAASLIYIAVNLTLGLFFGWAIGLPMREILVIAGVTTISSSAIVAKVIVDLKRSARPETGLILGIIMGEDIFLALYIALVSGLVLYGSTSAAGTAAALATAVSFVVALLALGRYIARRLTTWLGSLPEDSVLLVAFASLFLISGLAESLGLAEAIGALLIGLVVAETGHAQRIQRMVFPFRDFFGAFLFFSFGLSIDPRSLGGAVGLAIAAAALTIAGNLAAGIIAGRVTGLPAAAGVSVGLTVLSRGEFSIVMASMARTGGLLPIIQPFTATYVLILSILGPILTNESDRVYVMWCRMKRRIFRLGGKSPAPCDGLDANGPPFENNLEEEEKHVGQIGPRSY